MTTGNTLPGAQDDAESVAVGRPSVARVAGSSIVTAEHKERLLAWLYSGRSVASFLRGNPDAPSYSAFQNARNLDPEFGKQWEAARVAGLEALIDEAGDYAFACRGDKALAIAADRYSNTVQRIAEKLAPKQFGPMLKHAGHDGEALSVSVVSYKEAPAAIEGGKLSEITDDNA